MSIEATAWALNDAQTDGPLERLVLIYLANDTTPDGTVGAADWQAIADRAGVAPDAVELAVARMRRRGLIDQEVGRWVLCVPWAVATPLVGPAAKDRIHPADRAFIYERDGDACLRCGTPRDLTIDHVHPESLGGESTRENFQTLCRSCNAWKGVRIGAEFDYRTQERPL